MDEENITVIEEGGEGPKGLPWATQLQIVIGLQVVFAVTGAIGNITVLYIFGRRRERLTSTLGILVLAGKDIFSCAFIIPFLVAVEANEYRIKYDFFCKLFHLVNIAYLPFTVFTLTAIAVDRCLCLCHSIVHVVKINRARILLFTMLLTAVVIAIPPTLGFGVYMTKSTFQVINKHYASSNKTWYYENHGDLVYTEICHRNGIILTYADLYNYFKFYLFLFVAPLVCTGLLYTAILAFTQYRKWKTQHTAPESRLAGSAEGEMTSATPEGVSGNDQLQTEEDSNYREQIHFTMMMFIATLVFYVVFLPPWLMAHRVLPFNLIVFYLYLLHSASNPIVYVCMDSSFRNELKNLLRRSWARISL